jgi:hypothetical protein
MSRFVVTAALMLLWYSGLHPHAGSADFAAMAVAAAATIALVALMRREKLPARSFSRWDEAAAWLGIAALARLLAF